MNRLCPNSHINYTYKDKFQVQNIPTREIRSRSNSSDSETPILFLDVNFGNGEITRIVMYENDKPEELAEAFCIENGLDLSKKDRLVEIIYQQLESVLEKIEEESEGN